MSVAALLLVGITPGSAAPDRDGGISGVVYSSAASTGLAGAKVIAYALPGLVPGCVEAGPFWTELASTKTDAVGAYRLDVAPGSYRIGVVPSNLAQNSFGFRLNAPATSPNVTSWVGWADDVAAPATNVNVKLSVPGTIQGVVGDWVIRPVGNIEVKAFAGDNGDNSNSFYRPSGYVPSGVSDRNGHYVIKGLPTGLSGLAGTYAITMTDPTGRHEDWISPPGPFASPGDTYPTQYMRETRRLVGTVLDESGHALAGITVWPLGKAYPLPMLKTNANGQFVTSWFFQPKIGPLDEINVNLMFLDPKGVYRTTYYSGERFQGDAAAIVAPVGFGDVTITQRLQNGASAVTGTAVYPGPSPAPGTWISVMQQGATQDQWGLNETFGVAACDGAFTVSGIWPGAHTIYVGGVAADVTTTAGGTVNLGTITLP